MGNYEWNILGHQKVISHLQGSIENNKLAHAYIFSGPAHLGKKLVVEKFIASVLCHDYHHAPETSSVRGQALPCKNCPPCKQLEKNIHPDVYWVKKDEEKMDITIEQIRELKEKLSLSSFLNSYKIAVIEEADKMNENSQNALLKILEEPTKKTIIVLLSADYSLLLPTIVSRSRLIKFHRVKSDLIFNYLTAQGASHEQAMTLTQLAAGRQGLAIDYFKNQEMLAEDEEKARMFFKILQGELYEKFDLVDSLVEKGAKMATNIPAVAESLNLWQLLLRDMAFIKLDLEDYVSHYYLSAELKKLSQMYTSEKIVMLIKNIDQIKRYLERNVNLSLALENLALSF